MFVRNPKVLKPLFYVSKPIFRSIWVQPAVGCDAINDDRAVPKNTEEKLGILGVETIDVILNKGLDLARWFASHSDPPAISLVGFRATIRIRAAPATSKINSSSTQDRMPPILST